MTVLYYVPLLAVTATRGGMERVGVVGWVGGAVVVRPK